MSNNFNVLCLTADDVGKMRGLLRLFGEAFDEPQTYTASPPDDGYLRSRLQAREFIALVAEQDGKIVGGLVAYELPKFEQPRSEIYIYDLAVAKPQRRQGVATELIRALQGIASERGAWVIFVQADQEDEPAIALYTKLGIREDVLHFDIRVAGADLDADA